MTTRTLLSMALLLLVGAAPARAQCEGWLATEPKFDWVRAVVAWDPDGAGPQQEWLVVGGAFYRGIMAWDGREWHGFGAGLSDKVCSLAIYNGEFVAGGRFPTAIDGPNLNGIARWDGGAWQPLGSGMQGSVSRSVDALAV